MSEKPKSTKTRGKRDSKPPEPTGDSSDSGRSRSLSNSRSSSRRVEGKKKADTQSKWQLSASQYIQSQASSSDSDKDNFSADSVSRRVKFRRSKELKTLVTDTNSEALAKYTIPKKDGKQAIKDMSFGLSKNPPQVAKQELLAPSGSGLPGDAGNPEIVVGYSGKVLGYRNPADVVNPQPEMYVKKGVEIPMKSKIGSGVYLPLAPAFGPGSGQPKLGPQGVISKPKPTPYSRPNPKQKLTLPVSIPVSGAGDVVVGSGGEGGVANPVPNSQPIPQPDPEGQDAAAANDDADKGLTDDDVSLGEGEDSATPVVVDPSILDDDDEEDEDESNQKLDYEPAEADKEELEVPNDNDLTVNEGKLISNTTQEEIEAEISSSSSNTNITRNITENGSETDQDSHESPVRKPSKLDRLSSSLLERGIFTQPSNVLLADFSEDDGDNNVAASSQVVDPDAETIVPQASSSPRDPESQQDQDLDMKAEAATGAAPQLQEQGLPPVTLTPTILHGQQQQHQPPATLTEHAAQPQQQPESIDRATDQEVGQQFRQPALPQPQQLLQLADIDSWAAEMERNQELRRQQEELRQAEERAQMAAIAAQLRAAAHAAGEGRIPQPVPPPITSTPTHLATTSGQDSGKNIFSNNSTNNSTLSSIEQDESTNGRLKLTPNDKTKSKPKVNSNVFVFGKNTNTTPSISGEPHPTDGATALPPGGAKGKEPIGGVATDGSKAPANKPEAKPARAVNPRPDLLLLPEVSIENDTRRMTDGYTYTTREKFAQDKEFVRAAMQRARAKIATQLFGTTDVEDPTPTLKKFWRKTGLTKSKSLNEVVAILLNAPKVGWAQEYNKWQTLREGSPAWTAQATLLKELAVKIFTSSKSKTAANSAAAKKNPPPQKKKSQDEIEKEAKEAKAVEAIMKRGQELGIPNFASKVRPSTAPPKLDPSQSLAGSEGDKAAQPTITPTALAAALKAADSNKSKRFDKVVDDANDAANTGAKEAPAAANDSSQQTKSLLKPPAGLQKKPGDKRVRIQAPSSPDKPAAPASRQEQETPSAPSLDEEAQEKIDLARGKREKQQQLADTNGAGTGAGAKGRLGKNKAIIDFTLIDLLHQQEATHTQPPPPKPLPATPPQQDSGVFDAAAEGEETEDFLQVHLTKNDMIFSPDRDKIDISDFDPSKPPPIRKPNSQAITSTTKEGDVRKRVIVESLTSAATLSSDDLESFRSRLETHIFELNQQLPKSSPAARIMKPWIERAKIVVMPTDMTTGQFIIDLVNNKELALKGHQLKAGWNVDLPEVAMISVYYELASKRDPKVLIEDERNGIARQNGWSQVEKHEIAFWNSNPHKTNKDGIYTRVVVSKRVVGLIQAQKGQIWIAGGTANVQWNGKDLTHDNVVHYNFQ